jgi:heat shock protein HspQ
MIIEKACAPQKEARECILGEPPMSQTRARFQVGQPIHHKRFDYRGVIVDVDPVFCGTEEWYEVMATSRPPRDQPWYHVLVHDSAHRTYVAERNLEPDLSGAPIRHPEITRFFERFEGGLYAARRRAN